jgi:hypothetical protein
MDRLPILLLIALAIGAALGAVVHRRAVADEKVHGGLPALILHYLGAAVFSSALPAVLLTVFSGLGFLTAVAVGFSCFLIALLLLMAHAAVELKPRAAALLKEDEGWTAEKAKSSGL